MMNDRSSPWATTDAADARPSLASTAVVDDTTRPDKAPSPVASSKKSQCWYATLVLHIASIVISVIYIIITGVMSQDKYGITLVAFYAWIGLAAPVLSLLVSVPELVARFLRPSHEGWVPAVHIGINLLTWLVSAGFGIFSALAFGNLDNYNVDFGDWEDGCPSSDMGLECWGVPLYPYFRALVVFMFVLMGIHLGIFAVAINQHRRRRVLKEGRVGVV